MQLLKKTKKELNKNVSVKYITENNFFWKTIQLSITDKTLKDERITLVVNNEAVSNDSKIVEICSKYFENIVRNLGADDLRKNIYPYLFSIHNTISLYVMSKYV